MTPRRILLLGVPLCLLLSLAFAFLLNRAFPQFLGNEPTIVETSDQARFESCLKRTAPIGKTTEMEGYEKIWRLCGNEVYNLMLFADFEIRRNKFVRQELDERVNLWLVVAITISGVFLAAIQLVLSYRLASLGKAEFARDTSLLAENGRISLQSSVTGVVILFISLAFFFVYVKWIYAVQEFQIERPDNLRDPPAQLMLSGGLGPPPPPANLQAQPATSKPN
jgi:hypothetical protein